MTQVNSSTMGAQLGNNGSNKGFVAKIEQGVGNYFSDIKEQSEVIANSTVDYEKAYLKLLATSLGGVGTSVIMAEMTDYNGRDGILEKGQIGIDNYFTSIQNSGEEMGKSTLEAMKAGAKLTGTILGGVGLSVIKEFFS